MSNRTQSAEELAVALSLRRTMIFLTVEWSGPERAARQVFREAAKEVRGVSFCILDEEAEAVQAWLSSLGLPAFGGGFARGAGAVIWLEQGRLLSFELNVGTLGVAGLVSRTKGLWANVG